MAERKKSATGEVEKGAELSTRREVAQALGVHMATVTKWESQGLPVVERGSRGRPSRYDIDAVRAWLASRDREARKSAAGPLDPVQEKAARDHWQAELARQTHEIRHKTLLPAADVERAWAEEIAGVRAKLLALPTAFADRIHRAGTLGGVAAVDKALQAAVYDVLRQFAGEEREKVAV